MFYKLSNIADLNTICNTFNASFEFPDLYKRQLIIDGNNEESLPIITNSAPSTLKYAIWGLMPQNFKEDWTEFQNVSNTLNLPLRLIDELIWTKALFNNQRCVIITTGFFTSYIDNGKVHPFYVCRKHNLPFAIAGIYSQLEDGFLTTSILTSKKQVKNIKNIHNVGKAFPLVIAHKDIKSWFSKNMTYKTFKKSYFSPPKLKAYPVSQKIYKGLMSDESILNNIQNNELLNIV